MNVPEPLKSPLAKVSGGLAGILAVLNPEVLLAVFDALVASGPQLFSVVSVGALTLPQVFPPESTADWVVVAAAGIFGAYLLREINQKFNQRGL